MTTFIPKMIKSVFRSWMDVDEILAVHLTPHITCSGIAVALTQKKPFLVSRLGWFETFSIGYYDKNRMLSPSLRKKMWNTPGIFPATDGQFERFHAEYTSAMKSVDILGLMRCPYEKAVITKYAPHALLCELRDLEPYYNPVPWSKYLEGLQVLVVHPFASSIEHQYATARKELFADKNVLPEFQLQTLKPPQTLCENTDGFTSWHEALLTLKEKVSRLNFDVAVVGCGAYGLPVGAFIKELGKVCIHMGGATQALFGISGSRWLYGSAMSLYVNPLWKRPEEIERPLNWEQAEDGCYW